MSSSTVISIDRCRACVSDQLSSLLSIGDQYVSDFVDDHEIYSGHIVPIELVICRSCTLIQQRYSAPQDFLYTRHYWYRSGLTTTMRTALEDVTFNAVKRVPLNTGDIVLDIGSNDGTLLRSYTQTGIIRIGVEPALNLKEEGSKGIDLFINDFWSADVYYDEVIRSPINTLDLIGTVRPKIITACGMFYDLEDPNQFIADISYMLHNEGIFITQLMCAKQMYELQDVGNLAHEHLEFYTLESLRQLFLKHGLKIVDIEENTVNGGSYRLYVKHNKDQNKIPIDAQLRIIYAFENERDVLKLHDPNTWKKFDNRIRDNAKQVYTLINKLRSEGKSVYVLGASTKGNVILQQMGLDHRLIQGASDKSPEKVGKYTIGTGIPILSEEEVRSRKPDYLLVIPYSFLQEFTVREQELKKQGTKFIVPIPKLEVV